MSGATTMAIGKREAMQGTLIVRRDGLTRSQMQQIVATAIRDGDATMEEALAWLNGYYGVDLGAAEVRAWIARHPTPARYRATAAMEAMDAAEFAEAATHHTEGGPMSAATMEMGPARPSAAPAASIVEYIASRLLAAGKRVPPVLQKAFERAMEGRAAEYQRLAGRPAAQAAQPDPFDGREVTGLYLAPDGRLVKRVRVGEDEPQQYAEPSSPWSAHAADGPDLVERPRGDERIVRRRRITELQRELMIKRKKAKGAAFADRERWDRELSELSAELEALIAAEREARTRRNFGSDGGLPTGA